MAKRFTDSEKWRDPWFTELAPEMKLLWLYLLDNCDHAGIWKVNRKLAEFEMGVHPPWGEGPQSVPPPLAGRVFQRGDYWFIPKFLLFQYGRALNRGDAAKSSLDRVLQLGFNEIIKTLPGGSLEGLQTPKAKATAKAMATAVNLAHANNNGDEDAEEVESDTPPRSCSACHYGYEPGETDETHRCFRTLKKAGVL